MKETEAVKIFSCALYEEDIDDFSGYVVHRY
jgi:hypothetical protein